MVKDLEMDDDDPSGLLPDPPLSPAQPGRVEQLSVLTLQEIDSVIPTNVCDDYPRKVAMVVGLSIATISEKYPNVPDVFYAGRIRKLADDGLLESFDNLNRMKSSEVRLKLAET